MTANLHQLIVRLNNMVVQTVVVDRPVLTIGRATGNTLALPHPLVSRHHAEIRREAENSMVVVDLGSANGIFLNGERMPAQHICPLTHGAVVQIGPYALTYNAPVDARVPVMDVPEGMTVLNVRADIQIQIDPHQRQQQVEEITDSAFFQHLRDEKGRMRLRGAKPPEDTP